MSKSLRLQRYYKNMTYANKIAFSAKLSVLFCQKSFGTPFVLFMANGFEITNHVIPESRKKKIRLRIIV